MGYILCSFSMQFNLLDKMITGIGIGFSFCSTVSFIKAHLVAREVPGAARNSWGKFKCTSKLKYS